jgi:hypothetical protein
MACSQHCLPGIARRAWLAPGIAHPIWLVPGITFLARVVSDIACPAWLVLVNNFSHKFDDSVNQFDD